MIHCESSLLMLLLQTLRIVFFLGKANVCFVLKNVDKSVQDNISDHFFLVWNYRISLKAFFREVRTFLRDCTYSIGLLGKSYTTMTVIFALLPKFFSFGVEWFYGFSEVKRSIKGQMLSKANMPIFESVPKKMRDDVHGYWEWIL